MIKPARSLPVASYHIFSAAIPTDAERKQNPPPAAPLLTFYHTLTAETNSKPHNPYFVPSSIPPAPPRADSDVHQLAGCCSLLFIYPKLYTLENVFAEVMPVTKAFPLVQRGRFNPFDLTLQREPADKENPQVFRLCLALHIFDVKWADEYPGCKIIIELSHDTFDSAEQCAGIPHLQKITRGDRIVFNDYEPGFTYEFTRLLQLKDNVSTTLKSLPLMTKEITSPRRATLSSLALSPFLLI